MMIVLIVVEVLVCNECLFANSASPPPLPPPQCGNYGDLLSLLFDKNFVKSTFILYKLV